MPLRYLLVLAAFALMVLLYVDRACISVAKGDVARDLGLSNTQMGWVFGAFSLGYALCQTPAGMLADRLGPRRVLAVIVAFWSAFTGLTALAWSFSSMLATRFLFGCGEAGALPGVARAVYSWIPLRERGLVQGVSFSGMRFGAAATMPLLGWMIGTLGWRPSFLILMVTGLVWSAVWFLWFRDDPTQKQGISRQELEFILDHRQEGRVSSRPLVTAPAQDTHRTGAEAARQESRPSAPRLFHSRNLWLAMGQYFCSNFTFFFCLTWLPPYIKEKYALDPLQAGLYASLPLIGGGIGNIAAGWLVDRIYRAGRWTASRRLPAVSGFLLAAFGLVLSRQMETPGIEVGCLALAIFGADMTLPPSWSLCVDIGQKHSGAVSGTMNMAGNLGSFLTTLAFPYLIQWTGGPGAFFYVGATLNLFAVVLWFLARPDRKLEEG
ncbi:MAG TPA: MFS transporter [Candidatus Paceibacterota bacterium]|nr:MFS transporter [Verrucomicrobiota bacterium]HRY49916.1 MFS transporter [Candidatus Paceibacterota bacterium]